MAGAPAPADALLKLLAHPNIASKEDVVRRYDHEVGAATVIKPLVGRAGPSDAAVLQPLARSNRGVVVAHGINPLYGALDPHAMAMLAVDEALRNLVAVGGSIDRAALLDNFCWGDVDDPTELGALVRAAQGCHDAALAYRVPFISGKDSLRNTSLDDHGRHSIPGTLLISAVGVVPDVGRSTTMDLKSEDSSLYLLGWTADELGASHYLQICGAGGGQVPRVRPAETRRIMRRLARAIRRGLVRSCHDLSEGGLAVAAAEMAIAVGQPVSSCGIGLEIDLERVPGSVDAVEALLFAESAGRFLIEVAPEHRAEVERLFKGLPHAQVGRTTQQRQLVIQRSGTLVIDLAVEEMEAAWRGTLSADRPAGVKLPSFVREADGSTVLHADAPQDARTTSKEVPGAGGHSGSPATLLPSRVAESYPSVDGERKTGQTTVRALVLAAAGVNCDRETIEACRLAGAEAELVHLNQLLRGERKLGDFGLLIFPGGFSYGDHLGAGGMLATVLRSRMMDEIQRFVDDGRPVLGICNGFQVLARLGFLGEVSLAANCSGRFECRWVPARVEESPCVFLRGLEQQLLHLPIAHGQGRVVLGGARNAVCAPLRYVENPNGSMDDIGGVCNPTGNVFGLMPHPERYVHRYQHPAWRRRVAVGDHRGEPLLGLTFFQNAVRYVREEL